MKIINMGQIIEIEINDQIFYNVILFHSKIKKEFKKIEDALSFIKINTNSFFSYSKIINAYIEYIHINDKKHFIIFSKNDNKEIIVYEETEFEFIKNHPHKYSLHASWRKINERFYSFSDVIRSGINWTPFLSFWIMIISIILIIMTGTLIVYGLKHIDEDILVYKYLNSIWGQASMFIVFILINIMTIVMWKDLFISNKNLFTKSYVKHDIDWLKLCKKRKRGLLMMSLVFLFGSFIVGFYAYELWQTHFNQPILIVIFLNIIFWFLYFSTIIYAILSINFYSKKTLLKNFNNKEILNFFKWKKGLDVKEIYKTDESIFVFKEIFSKKITKSPINQNQNTLKNLTRKELVKIQNDEKNLENTIIKNYLKSLKRNHDKHIQ